ncbi:uncharacterized protein TNCV_2680741 [Trichonephila clavipes]|uniref:Uncharacterized protein n=1 Tax=Trichonephila clavipes TaxID=2585209 RepID=A0A8X6SBI9_TRICX|nr:uncharacterized protein TNCV_2680741 [Trichonephila clavipes]
MLKHLRFNIFELQETKLPVRLINTPNERRLVQGHETTPLRRKGDIEDAYSTVWTIGVKGCTSWMKRPGFYWRIRDLRNSSKSMTTIKFVKRENNLKCSEIL